jgi:hypothetical protein
MQRHRLTECPVLLDTSRNHPVHRLVLLRAASVVTLFYFFRLREAIHDLAHVLVHFLVLFLAAVLQFSDSSLCRVCVRHSAPVTTVGMVVEVVFDHCF